jgi:hypothetical protein
VEASEHRRWIGTRRGRVAVGLAASAITVFVVRVVLDAVGEPTAIATAPLANPSPAVVTPASSAGSASAPEAAVVSQSPPADDEVQMCGGAWVKFGADGQVAKEEAEAFERRAIEATRAPTLAAMEASGDERAQAAAHFLQSVGASFSSKGCEAGDACVQSADARQQAAEPHRAALARLAQGSTDPQVYAWAYQACRQSEPRAPGSCQLVNVEQWARLDPSNAMPWLTIAGEAEKRHDSTALDDAMFHVASAERMDTRCGTLPSILVDHVPPGEAHLLGALYLEVEAIGVDAAIPIDYFTATKYCGANGLVDANRRETCTRVAELLIDRSTTLLERNIGTSMAKRLGWPAERIQSIEEERDALFNAFPHEMSQVDGSHGCENVRRELERIHDVARYGEIGSLRRTIEASGKPVKLLAANYREALAERQEKARQEEVAASAAPAPYSASAPPTR